MSLLLRWTHGAGDTTVHYPSDGYGGFTSIAAGSTINSAATYTSTGATLAANSPGSAVGTKGLAITSDGFYAPYTVTVAGAAGSIAVDIWRNGNLALVGTLPTGTLTLHRDAVAVAAGNPQTGSVLSTYGESILESAVIRLVGAGEVINIVDATQATVDAITVVATQPNPIWELDGKKYKGIFGFKMSSGAAIDFDIEYRGQKPSTDARLKPVY